MGGKGSGGLRTGAGRKPKLKAVPRSAVKPPSTNSDAGGAESFEEFDAPDELTREERAYWLRLAPHAFRRRTLTKSTALSFELLCRNLALERRIAVDPDQVGGANHRGVIQRIDAELLRFDLSPNGKPHSDASESQPKPLSALERLKARQQSMRVVKEA